jgi:hypothetical protein
VRNQRVSSLAWMRSAVRGQARALNQHLQNRANARGTLDKVHKYVMMVQEDKHDIQLDGQMFQTLGYHTQ